MHGNDEDLGVHTPAFVRSAVLAERAGFDGIEIQAAHSYLLDEFMWAGSNVRTDGYGGPDIRDRVRFPAEIVAAVRDAISAETLLGFRFSQYKPIAFDAQVVNNIDELGIVIAAIEDAGADIFHASALRFDDPAWKGSDQSLAALTKSLTALTA